MLEPKSFYEFTKFCQILILTLWFVTLSCFLAKIAQILQTIIVFFLERGEEIEPWFWHIWIAQWLKFFPTTAYIFRFRASSGGNGWSKLGQNCELWDRIRFWDHICDSKGPKTSQKGPFHGCWIGTQNFEKF